MEAEKKMKTALITGVERAAVYDGRGLRTIVFFKGCPLRCGWCHNPETSEARQQFTYTKTTCMLCGACVNICPTGAITWKTDNITHDQKKCTLCGKCVQLCPTKSVKFVGEEVTVDQLAGRLMRDRVFFKNSNGGVTLSGGEVTLYAEFASELLSKLQANGINTTIETCGYCPTEMFAKVVRHVDTVFFDIKHCDPVQHKKYTGKDNHLILKNLRLLQQTGVETIARYPLIPSVNDSDDVARGICSICLEYGIDTLHILPFHQMGKPKWEALGKNYAFEHFNEIDETKVQRIRNICESFGLKVDVGGGEFV